MVDTRAVAGKSTCDQESLDTCPFQGTCEQFIQDNGVRKETQSSHAAEVDAHQGLVTLPFLKSAALQCWVHSHQVVQLLRCAWTCNLKSPVEERCRLEDASYTYVTVQTQAVFCDCQAT